MSTKVAIAKLDVDLAAGVLVRLWFAHAKARRRDATGLTVLDRAPVSALAECPIDLICHGFHEIGQRRPLLGGDVHFDRNAGLKLIGPELRPLLVRDGNAGCEENLSRNLVAVQIWRQAHNLTRDLRRRLLAEGAERAVAGAIGISVAPSFGGDDY